MDYFNLVDGQNVSRVNFFGDKFLCVGNGSIDIGGSNPASSHSIALKTLSFGLTTKKIKITHIKFIPSFSIQMRNSSGAPSFLNILLGQNSGLFDIFFKSNFCSLYVGDDLNGFIRSDSADYIPRLDFLNTYPNQIPFNLQSSLFPHNENYDLPFYSTKKNNFLNFTMNLDFSMNSHTQLYNYLNYYLENISRIGFDYDAVHIPLPRYYNVPYITIALFQDLYYEIIIQGEIINDK